MERHTRRPNRLANYDYSSAGYYFITVCTKERALYLRRGAQCAPELLPPLTAAGTAAEWAILQIPAHYPHVCVDKYVIMPNHVHMILAVAAAGGRALRAPTISHIIRTWKEAVTKRIGLPLWQKSFHDHVIRGEADYLRIWAYIDTNPLKWREDRYYMSPVEGDIRP